MDTYRFRNQEFVFEYNLDEVVSHSCFSIFQENRKLSSDKERARYPFDYDYIRLFHGTHENVFYTREHKPVSESKGGLPDLINHKEDLANSLSILEQGYYRSRNDALNVREGKESIIWRWKNKLGQNTSRFNTGIFCSWMPTSYGEIVFDIVVSSSEVAINIDESQTLNTSEEMSRFFDSPEEFLKEIDSKAEKYEVIIDEKIPIDKIIGVSENSSEDFHFKTFTSFVNTLDREKLPESHVDDQDLQKFEKLKKIWELFNNEDGAHPLLVLRYVNEALLLFTVYNSKDLPNVSVRNYEMPRTMSKTGLDAHEYLKQNLLESSRNYPEKKRKKKAQKKARSAVKNLESYNTMVNDVHSILGTDLREVDVSRLGEFRSLTREAMEKHEMDEVIAEDLGKLVKDCRKNLNNEGELSTEDKKAIENTLEYLQWLPIIEFEGSLGKMVESYS